MSRTKRMLAALMGMFGLSHLSRYNDPMPGSGRTPKKLSNRGRKFIGRTTFKPAFSMGYRGFPRTLKAPGSTAAPTIDQVRRLERKYGVKLHVKNGLLFFKEDGKMFSKELAQQLHRAIDPAPEAV